MAQSTRGNVPEHLKMRRPQAVRDQPPGPGNDHARRRVMLLV
jgi:hypothetical protein